MQPPFSLKEKGRETDDEGGACSMKTRSYIAVRSSQIRYYRRVPLFYESAPGVFQLYKPAGAGISEVRLDEGMHPKLYIQENDREKAALEVHRGFNQDIARDIREGDVAGVKETLCRLVEETLSEPRAGTVQALPETMSILVSGYSRQPAILRTLATISNKDYSTVIHSVNVMALTLSFCFFSRMSLPETRRLGLCALLHDVGKTEIPAEILQAPRRLTAEEFAVMKAHPVIGERIIRQFCRLNGEIVQGALEHHEKLDGSGYPRGIRRVSFAGQLIGIIDCYEALTNEERPYRRAQDPLETLRIIKEDVERGKFSRRIFEKFCYSLV